MKIIVFSDSHGNFDCLNNIVLHNQDAEVFIHLGDGKKEFEDIQCLYPNHQYFGVCGNCDYFGFENSYKIFSILGKKFFITHGHCFGINYSLDELKSQADKYNCDICLFGHLHIPSMEVCNGKYIINPGSASVPRQFPRKKTYCEIIISPNGNINITHKEVTL